MFWNKNRWSKHPGCFERHLQRRDGNVLFPTERRNVSAEEIEAARAKDRLDQEQYDIKLNELASQLKKVGTMSPNQAMIFLQNFQSLIEETASIGGEAFDNKRPKLEEIEDSIIQQLNLSMPDGKKLLDQAKSLSAIERVPYLAQMKRKDTPIFQIEHISTLLSEDLKTISLIGFMSRSFPDFKPSEADIMQQLDDAVRQGFDKDRARNIIEAWNQGN